MKKKLFRAVMMALCLLAVVLNVTLPAVEDSARNDNSSPYFLVQGDKDTDGFPLLKTEARVSIAGMSSEVELIQVYKNNGKKTLEAVYVFPMGARSAIHAMKMKIGKRVIEAKIEEKEKARETYNKAKENGQTTSLLEQKRPNVFQMNVANILPGDVIEVMVKYTEALAPENGVYSFVFPTVVGPRFTGESKAEELRQQGSWTAKPYLKEGSETPYELDIRATLKTGMPIARIWSPSHKVDVHEEGTGEATVTLSPEGAKKGNKDFILNYCMKGNAIQTGVLLYPTEKENYFLMMMEPPQRVSQENITPREYLFIVDVSGSMHGFPLDTSKALITKIINGLREKDYFNIMFFSGGSDTLSERPVAATEENKQKAFQMLSSFNGGGGTEILNALQKAYALEKKEGLSRIIVAATDGYVSVEKESFDLIRSHLNEGNFFAFGIGTSVNRFMIEGMARAGKGEPFIVTKPEEAEEQAEKFFNYTQAPVLTDIKVAYDGFDAYDVEPPAAGDLFAERPIVLFGKYHKAGGSVTVTGRTARGDFKKTIPVTKSLEKEENTALQYLWAREKIARLGDYAKVGQDNKGEITKLGLDYHLMTEYTSFVAVDSEKRSKEKAVTVDQPLPLPEGVSNYAVGQAGCLASMKCAAAPAVCREMKCDKAKVLAEDLLTVDAKKAVKQKTAKIYVSGGVFLKGMSAYEFETVYLAQIVKGLEKIFQRDGLTGIRLELDIRSGTVILVKTLNHYGQLWSEKLIHNLVQKLRLPAQFTGTMEVELKYY